MVKRYKNFSFNHLYKKACHISVWWLAGWFALMVLGMIGGGCSTHRKTAKQKFTHSEELKIEKDEVEGRLKGDVKKVLEEAFEWLDTPYAFGRQDKGVATDCSGLVMVVFEKTIGCKLPRNSAKQAEFCETVKQRDVKPGDLVFFITNKGDKINHVGIMIDKEKFIHASSRGVVVSSMKSDYYRTHMQKFGRVPCLEHK